MNCLFIFTRDFRLQDNTTLNYLLSKGYKNIIPLFVFTPQQISCNDFFSSNSVQCMCNGLENLNEYLKGNLNIIKGEYTEILSQISKNLKINCVAINKDITPFARGRDKLIKQWCSNNNIKFISKYDYSLLDLDLLKTQKGTPYETFFHFNSGVKKNKDNIKVSNYNYNQIKFIKLLNGINLLNTEDLKKFYKTNKNNIFLPFTRERILEKLSPKQLDKFKNYSELREYPRYNTTLFSAYLKYGLVSIREVYLAILNHFGVDSELLRQIVWREFYYYLMFHLPVKKTVGGGNLQGKNFAWINDDDLINHWKNGTTGFPFVDASMRQLNQTGWMHNRSRLLVANALVYLFHCDWKIGEKYFAQKLADYDISQNNGNWQWCGGVGIDRKPYLRMYNPDNYIQKHDPDCVYIKRWCPELKNVDNKYIKNWEKYCTHSDNKEINYPCPIVSYKKSREISVKIFTGKNS